MNPTFHIALLCCALASVSFGGTLFLESASLEPSIGLFTGGGILIGLLAPVFLLASLAGAFVDFYPRRRLIIAALAAVAGTIALSGSPLTEPHGGSAWLSLAIVGLLVSVILPAVSSFLPGFVPRHHLIRANGIVLACIALAVLLARGSQVTQATGTTVIGRLDAWANVAAVVMLFGLPRRKVRQASVRRRRRLQIGGGFRYALEHRPVRELLTITVVAWFCTTALFAVAGPALVLGEGATTVARQSLIHVLIYGTLIGSLLLGVFDDAIRGERVVSWGFIAIGIGGAASLLGAITAWPDALRANLVYAGLTVVSAAAAATIVGYHALLQRIVANRCRGAVFGLHTTGVAAAILLAAMLALAVDRGGAMPLRGVLWLGTAIVALIAGVITIRVRVGRSVHGAQLLFLENLNSFLMRFLYRFRRIGPSTVPHAGPVIVVANHRCSLDPWLLCAGAPYRRISFLIAAEYADWPIVRYYVRQIECIPVRRDSRETRATKQAIRYLQAGNALGVFIEGGIHPPGEPPEPKDGAAVLALKTGATVIPAYISGIRYRDGLIAGVLTRHRARVRFGPAVELSEFSGAAHNREMVHAATHKIHAAIEALAPREPVVKNDESYDPARGASMEHST